jgi:WD40 repeat protein
VPEGPVAEAALRELQALLDAEVSRLPEKYRAPFVLCCLEGRSKAEAAAELGWKEGTVSGRLAEARHCLRARLARRGVRLSAALCVAALSRNATAAGVPAAAVRGVLTFAAGQGEAVPATAAVLAAGVLRAMALARLGFGLALGMGLGVLLGDLGLTLRHLPAAISLNASSMDPPAQRSGEGRPPQPPEARSARTDRYADPLPPGAVARLGTVHYRTRGPFVCGLGFLPDGKTLVSVTAEEHAIQLWDAATGKRLREISTGSLGVRSFARSFDGKYVAVNGVLPFEEGQPWYGGIGVWETVSRKELRILRRPGRDADDCEMAFTPDGKLLASFSGSTGILRIDEVTTGVELLRQQFPRDNGPSLAISPDGSTLAVATGPNTRKLYVWKWQAGEEPRELKFRRSDCRSLAFSPDGQRLAECEQSTEPAVRVWDVASGRLLQELKPLGSEHDRATAAVFSLDGKTLVTCSQGNLSGAVHLWDTATWQYRRRLDAVTADHLAISPDGRLLAGSVGGELRVWDLSSGKALGADREGHQEPVSRIVAAGDVVVTAAGDDRTVRIWDAATGKQRRVLTHGRRVLAIALSPDRTRLASSSLDDTVCLWDVATGRKLYSLQGHGQIGGRRAVGFTPDGKFVLAWGDDLFLRKWDVTTGKAVLEYVLRPTGVTVPDRDAPGSLHFIHLAIDGAFTSDGKTFVLNVGDRFHIFDVATGQDLRQIPYESGRLMSLVVSPDGQLLLASAHGRPVQTKLPDGRTQVAPAPNNLVGLWDLASGRLRNKVLLPQVGPGWPPVAFSADSKAFATVTNDPAPRIEVRDVGTGKVIGSVQGFRGPVHSLAFAPDGRRIISGMNDSTALVWEFAPKR